MFRLLVLEHQGVETLRKELVFGGEALGKHFEAAFQPFIDLPGAPGEKDHDQHQPGGGHGHDCGRPE